MCYAPTDQALCVIDDGCGIEVSLQDYEVQTMGGYQQEAGDDGITGIAMIEGRPSCRFSRRGTRRGSPPPPRASGTALRVGTIGPHVQYDQTPEFCDGREEGRIENSAFGVVEGF